MIPSDEVITLFPVDATATNTLDPCGPPNTTEYQSLTGDVRRVHVIPFGEVITRFDVAEPEATD